MDFCSKFLTKMLAYKLQPTDEIYNDIQYKWQILITVTAKFLRY